MVPLFDSLLLPLMGDLSPHFWVHLISVFMGSSIFIFFATKLELGSEVASASYWRKSIHSQKDQTTSHSLCQ